MTGNARSILIVDNDASYRAALEAGLSALGYSVSLASDARYALRLLSDRSPGAIVLELHLPGTSGPELLRELRRQSDVPIVVISAAAEELDIVLCFELGADDFVPKPIRIRELQARIEAALRHWERSRKAAGMPTRTVSVVEVGPYRIDFLVRSVELNGERVDLALKEFDLLAHLATASGRLCSRQELMNDVWGPGASEGDDKTLDVHIRRLRLKLEKEPSHPKWIVTVRGVGYLLNDGRRISRMSENETS